MLEIGSYVDGKYKILSVIGRGGTGVVYLALNEAANTQWAIKEVRKEGLDDCEAAKQGFITEFQLLSKLIHPNIPGIVDVIDTADSFIIIMNYIEGRTLADELKESQKRYDRAIPQETVIAWAKQLCDVLGYLHTRTPAVIYRDMKPSNVMLGPDGKITLIDFGAARELTERDPEDMSSFGTEGYAAPEQFEGKVQADARTDIYCLGATLYNLVTGMNPGKSPRGIKSIREIEPSLSRGLESIILKCTQEDPDNRYQSVEDLMHDLENCMKTDDINLKKEKCKLYIFLTCVLLTAAFAATSLWGYFSAKNMKSGNYDNKFMNLSYARELVDVLPDDETTSLLAFAKSQNNVSFQSSNIEVINSAKLESFVCYGGTSI